MLLSGKFSMSLLLRKHPPACLKNHCHFEQDTHQGDKFTLYL